MSRVAIGLICISSLLVACGTTSTPPGDGGFDGGAVSHDGGPIPGGDAGPVDAGDAGDAGVEDAGDGGDAGPLDAGVEDGGTDGGLADGGADAGEPDAGDCDGGCGQLRECCHGECVNLTNNPLHCGACGVECFGSLPYCQDFCQGTPCFTAGCPDGGFCCGSGCCQLGQLCCDDQGAVSHVPTCFTPTPANPTCPAG